MNLIQCDRFRKIFPNLIVDGFYSPNLFKNQKEYLVEPTFKFIDSIDITQLNRSLIIGTIEAGLGAGKTFCLTNELVPKVIDINRKRDRGGIIFITAPQTTLVSEINKDAEKWFISNNNKEAICSTKKVKLIDSPKKITSKREYQHAQDLIEDGWVIVCICTIHSLDKFILKNIDLWERGERNRLDVLAAFIDEIHKGTGIGKSPENEELSKLLYEKYIGYKNVFKGKWFNALIALKPEILIGLTGTPTKFMDNQNQKVYVPIVENYPQDPNITPWVCKDQSFDEKDTWNITQQWIENVWMRRAEIAHWISEMELKWSKQKITHFLNKFRINANINGILKIPTGHGDIPKLKGGTLFDNPIDDAKRLYENLCISHKSKTFESTSFLTGEKITLNYKDGICGIEIDTSKEKTSTVDVIVENLNNPKHHSGILFVINKGDVGLNIINCQFLLSIRNSGKSRKDKEIIITQYERQFLGRGSRTAAHLSDFMVSAYSDYGLYIARNIIRFYVEYNQINYLVPSQSKHLISAMEHHVNLNFTKKDYLDYVQSLEDIILGICGKPEKMISSPGGKPYNLEYQKYKKDRCEAVDCSCYKDYVTNPSKDSEYYKLSLKERKTKYKAWILEVDHKDGKLEKITGIINPDDLQTLCANQHKWKTQRDKDYLNKSL